jgi:2-polyprenyl-6-methoxyphenol hydroxylase-like FAD-dependent oxidoreductase
MLQLSRSRLTLPQNRTIALGQARSEPILRSYLLAHFGVAVELATELVHFEQDDDGVSCDIVKHSVDGYKVEEHIRVEYVIGADGAKGRRDDPLVHTRVLIMS